MDKIPAGLPIFDRQWRLLGQVTVEVSGTETLILEAPSGLSVPREREKLFLRLRKAGWRDGSEFRCRVFDGDPEKLLLSKHVHSAWAPAGRPFTKEMADRAFEEHVEQWKF